MFFYKLGISALLIALASELAKRSTLAASILASLPMTSLIVLCFLYFDTRDAAKVPDLSLGIFWAVLPSLLFLILLPILIRSGYRFPAAMAVSVLAMVAAYSAYVAVLGKLGIRF